MMTNHNSESLLNFAGMPSQSYWEELFSNKDFQRIQPQIRRDAPTLSKENPEVHDVKSHLMQLFERITHRHWLNRPDAFDLLEKCLQPCGSKRISAKQALEDVPFLKYSNQFPTVSSVDLFTCLSLNTKFCIV